MSSQRQHIRRLAVAFTAGPMNSAAEIKARALALAGNGPRPPWLNSLAKKLSREFGMQPRPGWRTVADRIREHRSFQTAWARGRVEIAIGAVEPAMAPAAGAPENWALPAITTGGELAAVLRLHQDDLGWLTAPGHEHYHHRWHGKAKLKHFRLIEIPKPLLKIAQRGVLHLILPGIPPHEACHGFRCSHSVRDFVEPHCRQQHLLRMDLEDFFPSVTANRVLRLFMTAGYPESVSLALTKLCTHAVPPPIPADRRLLPGQRHRLAAPHLPQGAPTSPALANLCAFRLDCRLTGLAKSARATYTRYADDLLFSGSSEFAGQSRRFENAVSAIVIEEGFRPNHRKTRHLRPSQRQSAAGLVLNEMPNVSRCEYDRLKAILHNCRTLGPSTQNHRNHPEFAAHLRGKIAWHTSVSPARGARLSKLYERIPWEAE